MWEIGRTLFEFHFGNIWFSIRTNVCSRLKKEKGEKEENMFALGNAIHYRTIQSEVSRLRTSASTTAWRASTTTASSRTLQIALNRGNTALMLFVKHIDTVFWKVFQHCFRGFLSELQEFSQTSLAVLFSKSLELLFEDLVKFWELQAQYPRKI